MTTKLEVGQEVLVRGQVAFVYADGVLQVRFERADPMNNQIAFVEPRDVSPLTGSAGASSEPRSPVDESKNDDRAYGCYNCGKQGLKKGQRVSLVFCNECDTNHIVELRAKERHTDDVYAQGFADAMKLKLAQKRGEGYGGWENPAECTVEHLAELFLKHMRKPDMVDLGNFAMMLHFRIGGGEALVKAWQAQKREEPAIRDWHVRLDELVPSVDQIAEATADARLWLGAWLKMCEAERDVMRQGAEGVHRLLTQRAALAPAPAAPKEGK